jgi:hypothetical protein
MNKRGMDLFRQVVCNMVTALGMPAIDGDELDDPIRLLQNLLTRDKGCIIAVATCNSIYRGRLKGCASVLKTK